MTRTDKLKLDPDILAWAQQPDETADDFMRFKTYLELGTDRSLEQALENWNTLTTEKKRISLSHIKKLSALNRWTDRVSAWDLCEWEKENRRTIKQRKDMRDRHRRQGQTMQAKGLQALAALPVQAIGPNEARLLICEGSKLESTALGEAPETAIAAARASMPEGTDTSSWTPQERRARLMALHAEMAPRLRPGYDDDDDD